VVKRGDRPGALRGRMPSRWTRCGRVPRLRQLGDSLGQLDALEDARRSVTCSGPTSQRAGVDTALEMAHDRRARPALANRTNVLLELRAADCERVEPLRSGDCCCRAHQDDTSRRSAPNSSALRSQAASCGRSPRALFQVRAQPRGREKLIEAAADVRAWDSLPHVGISIAHSNYFGGRSSCEHHGAPRRRRVDVAADGRAPTPRAASR